MMEKKMEFVTQKGQLRFDVEVRKCPETVKVPRKGGGKTNRQVIDTYVNIYRVVDITKKGNERREVEPVACGVALHNPNDKYDKWRGKAIAMERALQQLDKVISKEDRGIIWDWFVEKFGGHYFLGNILPQKG